MDSSKAPYCLCALLIGFIISDAYNAHHHAASKQGQEHLAQEDLGETPTEETLVNV